MVLKMTSLPSTLLAVTALLVAGGSSFFVDAVKPLTAADEAIAQAYTIVPPDEKDCQGSCGATVRQGNQRVDLETGFPVALVRQGHQVKSSGSAQVKASQYLQENASKLGLKSSDLSDLDVTFTGSSAAGDTVRFKQTIDGIPVYGAEIAVTVTPTSLVNFVVNGYNTLAGLPAGIGKTIPRYSQASALQAAKAHLGVTESGDVSFESANLVIYPRRNGLASLLAWEIHVIPTSEPVGDWEVLYDAHTGKIFKATDKSDYAYVNGIGKVFDTDPLSSSGATYGSGGYTDNSDADVTELNAERFDRALLDLDFDGSLYHLRGPYAEIVDDENPKNGLFPQSSSSFDFTRSQDAFEAVNCYFHVDKLMRYLNIDLGLDIMPPSGKRGIYGGVKIDPHGLNGQDNSHYIGSSGLIAFGEGGVDDAEDADVIIHELGHGLHDWVTGGSLSQNDGLSEGTGDYAAQSYRRANPELAFFPGDNAYDWVFNWDGHNQFWNGRITDYTATYPGGLTGSIHTDGQIWSTCNMKIYDAIGRVKTDMAFWNGLRMTGSTTDQQEAAQAVLDAAANMLYSLSDLDTMQSIYQGCGYAVAYTVVAVCGNGILEAGEECDGSDYGATVPTCGDCTGGNPTCSITCTVDYSSCTGCPICGNGVLEAGEECDGLDFGSTVPTCGDCTGGNPVCDNACTIDLSFCTGCPCNLNGVCEDGENCANCPSDCASGSTSGAVCGNGICEAGNGENCVSCPADCQGLQGGKPNGRFCCGDGGGEGAVPCSDSRCTSNGFVCTNIPSEPGSYCCGDAVCDSGEDCSNCPLDCAQAIEICDDGIDNTCSGFVDCDDSGCDGNSVCSTPSCFPADVPCNDNVDCCSGNCRRGICKGN